MTWICSSFVKRSGTQNIEIKLSAGSYQYAPICQQEVHGFRKRSSVSCLRDEQLVLDLAGEHDQLPDLIGSLVLMREQAAGEDTGVLIDRPTESEVIELEGVTEAQESMRLTDFN